MLGGLWLMAVFVSIPFAFVAAYLVVATKYDSIRDRVVASVGFGILFAPFMFFAAYFLPLTIWLIVPAALVWWGFRRTRHREFR
jgi:hypothetical protein